MKIFIAGARTITSLDDNVRKKLMSICYNKHSVYIGDCYGVDAAVQNFFVQLKYNDVTVFASNGKARNNIGNWKIENIHVDSSVKGFDFYKQKDIAMANSADCGFMIWDGNSRGTLNNIINLILQHKKVVVYETNFHRMLLIENMTQLEFLIKHCSPLTQKMYLNLLPKENEYNFKQISFISV